jgi:hypothetical protein
VKVTKAACSADADGGAGRGCKAATLGVTQILPSAETTKRIGALGDYDTANRNPRSQRPSCPPRPQLGMIQWQSLIIGTNPASACPLVHLKWSLISLESLHPKGLRQGLQGP